MYPTPTTLYPQQAYGTQPFWPQQSLPVHIPYAAVYNQTKQLREEIEAADEDLTLGWIEKWGSPVLSKEEYGFPYFAKRVWGHFITRRDQCKQAISCIESLLGQHCHLEPDAQAEIIRRIQQLIDQVEPYIKELVMRSRGMLRYRWMRTQLRAAAALTAATTANRTVDPRNTPVRPDDMAMPFPSLTPAEILNSIREHIGSSPTPEDLQLSAADITDSDKLLKAFAPYLAASVAAPLAYEIQTTVSTPMAVQEAEGALKCGICGDGEFCAELEDTV